MPMPFNCKKCGLYLGEMEKGKLRNNSALLCSQCWSEADIAMQIAEMASKQSKDILNDNGEKVVDDLMGMFGMKKK